MIKVYHLSRDLDHTARLAITDPLLPDWKQAMADGTYEDKMTAQRVAAALDGVAKGFYTPVASVSTSCLDTAYRVTNSIDEAWYETNLDLVTPVGPARSSSVGDVFEDETGTLHVVDSFGFAPLGARMPKAAEPVA